MAAAGGAGRRQGDVVDFSETQICHAVGTATDRRRSWICFWERQTGKSRGKCVILGCSSDATVGAHVRIKYQKNPSWYYIIPTCQGCNKATDFVHGKGGWVNLKRGSQAVLITSS